MKKFTVITICLNEPRLERTCESIVHQSFQDFEWFVIDGGSEKKTLDTFEKYKYRMDYFVSKKNQGIYDAMNIGLANASGEWVNFMHAGDCFSNFDILGQARELLAIYGGFDVLHGILQYDGDRNFRGHSFVRGQSFVTDDQITREFWLNKTIPHPPAVFYKRILFNKFGDFDVSFKDCSCHEYNLRLYFRGCLFKHIDCVVAKYDNSGASWRNMMHHEERMRILHKYYSKNEISLNTQIKFKNLRARVISPKQYNV